MAINCASGSLTTAAECFTCLSEKQLRAVRIYLKCALINGTTVNCSPSTLVAAATSAGYMEMSVKQQMAVETYLDCQIANNGGGGGGGSGQHGNGSPIVTGAPATPGSSYVDDLTGNIWFVVNGVWNEEISA